ncbi:hypothetical protein VTN49DRAFT_4914 [Thermomyces lanuginosus]|uniref:uncharacterized protein n=1 Tax=Thermomyces lanuginosus TaxID=5541 RepID=UPI003742EEFF
MLSYGGLSPTPTLPGFVKTDGSHVRHFAMIYVNQNGEVEVEVSPTIRSSGVEVLTQDCRDRFMKAAALSGASGFNGTMPAPGGSGNSLSSPLPLQPFRLHDGVFWNNSGVSLNSLVPYHIPMHQSKRQRRNGKCAGMNGDASSPTTIAPPASWTAMRVGDERRMKKYYERAFEVFQQLNCRVIAKAYIRMVEPRKQVHHPYNGRLPGGGNAPEQLDPEATKPPWWPAGVTHREPDHLLKEERIRLLIHILRELRESHQITAEKLHEAALDVRRQITPPERWLILDEIHRIRLMEEKYQRGEIPGDTVIRVTQVHLGGPDFGIENDPERMKVINTGSHQWPPEASSNGGSLPALPSLTSSIDRPSVSLDAMKPPPPQSQQFGAHGLPSPTATASWSSSFDGSATYSPRPGESVQSSKDTPPSRSYEMSQNRGKPCMTTNYMGHPLLVSTTAAPSTVLWDNSARPSAPQYPQYETGFDKDVELS